MKKSLLITLALLIFWADANSQVLSNSIELNALYKEKLLAEFRNFSTINLDTERLNEICKTSKGSINFKIVLESNRNWELELEKNEIRAPKYQISINKESISPPDINLESCTTYKGHLSNNPDHTVRLSISGEIIEGYVMDGKDLMFIKPVSRIIKGYPNKAHFVVFNVNDVIDKPNVGTCGTDNVKAVKNAIQNLSTARATTTCRVLEIATEADFEFFQANGSDVTTANNTILGILNQVEGIYQTTFDIRFLVPFQSVWSTSSDPYSEVASPSSASNVFNQLANWWQANRSSVGRDIVFFFSAKTGHGVKGAARVVGATCDNLANSYAFMATEVTNELEITTAHEIGHLFNATHPNTTDPASCSPNRTIMCTDPSNLGRILEFSAFSQDEINAWIDGHNACLTDVLNVNIDGTNPVCSSGQFTVTGLPPNSSVASWSSANTNALTVTNGGVPTRQNNFAGSVDVTATGDYGNDGCTFTSTKTILVGNYLPFGTSSYNSNCSGNTFNIVNTSLSAACTANTSIYFSYLISDANYSNFVYTPVSVPSGAAWSSSGSYLYMTVTTPSSIGSRSATIALSATGPCGNLNLNFTSTAVNYSSYRFSISPNPSKENVTVSVNDEKLLNDASQKIYAIKITDPSGISSESFEYKSGINSVKISLQNFNSGLYILSVFDGKIWSSERLIVKK